MQEGSICTAATLTVLNLLHVPRAMLLGEQHRCQLGQRLSLGTSSRQHWHRFGDREDTVKIRGVFLRPSGRHWHQQAGTSPCPLQPSCRQCRRTKQLVGWISVASVCNRSSCARSWPCPRKTFPCFVAICPDSRLGELLSRKPGVLEHGDL